MTVVDAVDVRWVDRSTLVPIPDSAGERPVRRAVGRALISEMLAEAGVLDDSLVRTRGKGPRVSGGSRFVSLSHSSHLTVCAVSIAPVGIDIEIIDAGRIDRLGSRAPAGWFTEWERSVLTDDPSRVLELFTVKEAWGKLKGTGLDSRLGSIDGPTIRATESSVRFTPAAVPGAVCMVCHDQRLAVRVRRSAPHLEALVRAARVDSAERGLS